MRLQAVREQRLMGLTARRYPAATAESVISGAGGLRVVLTALRVAAVHHPVPRLTSVTRRHRHGRGLRVTDGVFPRSAVGRHRVTPVVEAAAARLTRLTSAGRPGSPVPAFEVDVAELPARDQVARCEPSDLADGALLAASHKPADGALVITVYARPMLLWTDRDRGLAPPSGAPDAGRAAGGGGRSRAARPRP